MGNELPCCFSCPHLTLRELLINLGKGIGDYLPWHSERDPFRVLTVEKLLQRTTRTNVLRVYKHFIAKFGTAESILDTSPLCLYEAIKELGLGKQRSQALIVIAKTLVEKYGGRVPCDRDQLISIPHVGDYIADAVLLYGYGKTAFPLDGGIQRVLRRASGLPENKKPPYSDKHLNTIAYLLLEDLTPREIVYIHRALLWLAWEVCKPVSHPLCDICILNTVCMTESRGFSNTL